MRILTTRNSRSKDQTRNHPLVFRKSEVCCCCHSHPTSDLSRLRNLVIAFAQLCWVNAPLPWRWVSVPLRAAFGHVSLSGSSSLRSYVGCLHSEYLAELFFNKLPKLPVSKLLADSFLRNDTTTTTKQHYNHTNNMFNENGKKP